MDIGLKEKFFCIEIREETPLDFQQIFGNAHPLTLEIGSGKGEFISLYSRLYPAQNFLGIELKQKRIVTTLKKLDIVKNRNVRLVRLFVDMNITSYMPHDSIDAVIINHPDPWQNRKHHKNRLIQPAFIDALHQILKPRGIIKISTDDPDYLKWICKVFASRNDYTSLYEGGYTMIVPEDHLWTYFDELQTQAGLPPAFMSYLKD